MHARPLFPRPLLALCWLILAAHAAMLAEGAEVDLSGTYQGHAPAADAAKRVFTLSLSADGTAIFTTQYIGKSDVIEHGRWSQERKPNRSYSRRDGAKPPSPAHYFSSSRPPAQSSPLGSQ